MLYFGYNSSYKENSVRFSLNHRSRKKGHGGVVSGYPNSTSLPWVDRLSTDPRVLGLHTYPLVNSLSDKVYILFSYLLGGFS